MKGWSLHGQAIFSMWQDATASDEFQGFAHHLAVPLTKGVRRVQSSKSLTQHSLLQAPFASEAVLSVLHDYKAVCNATCRDSC